MRCEASYNVEARRPLEDGDLLQRRGVLLANSTQCLLLLGRLLRDKTQGYSAIPLLVDDGRIYDEHIGLLRWQNGRSGTRPVMRDGRTVYHR